MTDTTTIRVGGTDAAVRPTAGEGWRLRPRHLLVVPGLAIAILANEVGKANGVGILFLVAFGIVPDLPRLFGLTRRGMGGPTVLVFNVLHHPVAALSALVVAAVGTVATDLLPMILAGRGPRLAEPRRHRLGGR